jgi:hypothetical protein
MRGGEHGDEPPRLLSLVGFSSCSEFAGVARYYRNGWRLLEQTKIAGMRMDQVTKNDVTDPPGLWTEGRSSHLGGSRWLVGQYFTGSWQCYPSKYHS